jgi:hypothetical protein
MRAEVIIVDDSVLSDAITSLCSFPCKRVSEYTALTRDAGLDDSSDVLIHVSYGSRRRTSAAGTEVAQSLRRDYRYAGRIQLYSIQPLDSLVSAHPFLKCVKGTELRRWNINFFTLPEGGLELVRTVAASERVRLADKELAEFVLRFCELERYFSIQLGNVAHWLQRENWRERFGTIPFKHLVQNIRDFGPSYAMRHRLSPGKQAEERDSGIMPENVAAAVALLEDGVVGLRQEDQERLLEAVAVVQEWLCFNHDVDPAPAGEAVQYNELILLADDDPYDSQQLERLGYRVEHLDEVGAVREFLNDERPRVFMCDLTWNGSQQTGLQLSREAIALGIPIVILMSAGPIKEILSKESLPKEIIICEGLTKKQDAVYIHGLIVRRIQEIEGKQDDLSLSTR